MRVLAASFPDDGLAREVRARLLADLALDAHQVGVETLAQSGDRGTGQTVLAGQFPEDVAAVARRAMEQRGGTVILDIDATETNA